MTVSWSRRTVLAGAAALAAARPAFAADATSPLAHGALADNALAKAFVAPQGGDLPDVTLIGPKGERALSSLRGRTLLMPLWAEWCAPCMIELPDFARLQRQYGSDKFAIVPILTCTKKKMGPEQIAGVFSFLHADVFEPLTEKSYGKKLMLAMARKNEDHYAIPCNLVVAPDGRVVAREVGLELTDEEKARNQSAEERANMLNRAEGGETMTLWGNAVGDAFVAAQANGFLA